MNPLEKLKQKLMAKPTLQELQPVKVAIRVETEQPTKPSKEADIEEGEVAEIPETKPGIEIIDENDKNYDRSDFLKRRAESKKSKVVTKFHAFTTCIESFLYSLLEYHAALRTIDMKAAIFSNANTNK